MCSDCRALAMRVLRTYQKMHATGSSFGCLFVLTTNLNLPQPVLRYGKLQGGGSELYFSGADIGTFWEEVVKPYSVLKVHKYATMFKLCFNSTSSMHVGPLEPRAGAVPVGAEDQLCEGCDTGCHMDCAGLA